MKCKHLLWTSLFLIVGLARAEADHSSVSPDVPDAWRARTIAGVGFRGLIGIPAFAYDSPRYAEMMKLPFFAEAAWKFALRKTGAPDYRKASDWPKHYAEAMPASERPTTPYRITDLAARPNVLAGPIDRPFFLASAESRPAYRLGASGFPLADRAHYAAWKRAHPNFLGFQALDEFDSDTTYYIRYYDRLGAPAEAIQRRYPLPPAEAGVGSWNWMKTAFGDTTDYFFGDRTMLWGLFSCSAAFCHMSAALGARGLFYECTSQSWSPWQVAGAYVRGAARQFDLPMVWYAAHYYEGYTRAGKATDGENCHDEAACRAGGAARRDGGASRTLLQRQALYGWLIGANMLQTEHWTWLYAEEKDKVFRPTREAHDINDFYLMTKRIDRGVSYAPLAILTPVDEPMQVFGASQHLRDRFGQHAAFATLVPVNQRGEGHRKAGYQGCLYNSPFADFYDVLVPDAGQERAAFLKALSAYRHAFLAGGGFRRETIDAEALSVWVRAGGTLYASADQVRAGVVPPELAGLRFGEETRPAGASFTDETGAVLPLHGDYRVRTATPEGAQPFARTASGTVLAWTHAQGKGRVVTVAVDRLIPTGFEDSPRLDEKAYIYKRFLPICRGEYTFDLHRWLFSRIQSETLPVAVRGDIQWGLNLIGRSHWLVYLINNKGVVKFVDEPEILDPAQTAHVTVDLKNLSQATVTDAVSGESITVTNGQTTVAIPPGGSRLLTIRN